MFHIDCEGILATFVVKQLGWDRDRSNIQVFFCLVGLAFPWEACATTKHIQPDVDRAAGPGTCALWMAASTRLGDSSSHKYSEYWSSSGAGSCPRYP